ncbi:MAG: ROK family transcriptional regulator [Actinobacteria bacterium]|nr:ROK family transcriptional regulator [Actinomycetota bacterium]
MDTDFPESKGSPQLMKQMNNNIVLYCIRKHEYISRADISRETGISQPTVSKIVDYLLDKRIIIEHGKGDSSGGRRPFLLSFNPDWGYVIGADLGGRRARLAAANLAGEYIEKRSLSLDGESDEENMEFVISEIESLKKQLSNRNHRFIALSIAIPGIVDIHSKLITRSMLFKTWKKFPLKEMLEKKFKVEVFVENDVNMHAFGELSYGIGRKFKNLVFVSMNPSIGAGVIINGEIYRGYNGASGELGFLLVGKKGLKYGTYSGGQLESMASVLMILERARHSAIRNRDGKLNELANNDLDKISLDLVFLAARSSDEECKTIIRDALEAIAVAITNVISVLNPEVVIIGGDIAEVFDANELVVKPLCEMIEPIVPEMPAILLSSVGPDAGLRGSIAFSLDGLKNKLLLC